MKRIIHSRPWAKATTWVPCKAYLASTALAIAGVLIARGGRP